MRLPLYLSGKAHYTKLGEMGFIFPDFLQVETFDHLLPITCDVNESWRYYLNSRIRIGSHSLISAGHQSPQSGELLELDN